MPTWDEIFRESPDYLGQHPAREAVLLASEMRKRGGRSVLDLGCGAGRNLVYLLKQGLEVFGTDISKAGLQTCRRRLQQEGLTADLRLADMTSQPYPDESFDGVLSAQVVHHNVRSRIQAALDEIGRVLRPGGVAAISLGSTNDYKRGLGPELEPETYLVNEGIEAGLVHHLSDRADVCDLVQSFRLLELREECITHHVVAGREQQPCTSAHWLCLFEKP